MTGSNTFMRTIFSGSATSLTTTMFHQVFHGCKTLTLRMTNFLTNVTTL
jgi:hypothetical protein